MLSKLKNIFQVYGPYTINSFVIAALAIISLITLDFDYFLYALLMFVVLMPLFQSISHEYVCHEYIVPRNQVIGFFLMLASYAVGGQRIAPKRNYHISHHRHWKNAELDPTQVKMQGLPVWRIVFNLRRPVRLPIESVSSGLAYSSRLMSTLDCYATHIHMVYVLSMFLLLPWQWFVTVVIYFPWISWTVWNWHDTLFHKNKHSKDHSFYLLLFGNGAWHVKHHSEYARNYYGPGLCKYLNLAWYYKLLLFKDNPCCLL